MAVSYQYAKAGAKAESGFGEACRKKSMPEEITAGSAASNGGVAVWRISAENIGGVGVAKKKAIGSSLKATVIGGVAIGGVKISAA